MIQVDCQGCGAPLSPAAMRCDFCGESVGAAQMPGGFAASLLEDLDEIESGIHKLESLPSVGFGSILYVGVYWYVVLSTCGIAAIFLPKPAKTPLAGKQFDATVSHLERQIDNARDLSHGNDVLTRRLLRATEDLKNVVRDHRKDHRSRFFLAGLGVCGFLLTALLGTAGDLDEEDSLSAVASGPSGEQQAPDIAPQEATEGSQQAADTPEEESAWTRDRESGAGEAPNDRGTELAGFPTTWIGRYASRSGIQVVIFPKEIRWFGGECPGTLPMNQVFCDESTCRWSSDYGKTRGEFRGNPQKLRLRIRKTRDKCVENALDGRFERVPPKAE